MILRNAYKNPPVSLRMHLQSFLIIFFSIFFSFLVAPQLKAQDDQQYEEILVYVEIPGIGGFELPSVISGTDVYLAVADLFDFLKVRNTISLDLDSISGFFINPEATYLVNYSESRIRFQERIYTVTKGDLIRTESNLYLKSDYFGRIFGLQCSFSFRSLSVQISSKLELPVIRELKLAEMRKNLTQLSGEVKADTNIGRTHPLFRFGMADWSVYASEEIKGRTDLSGNLSLGAMIAGGEATASLNYNSISGFKEKYQQYQWRYVDNDFKPLRQVVAGKFNTNATSTLYDPVIGIQLTNTPTTFRKSFGTYKLSDNTEPGWIVELYVNSVLVDYVTADASGFFTFDVPLVYGNTSVKLKFYGPWGEERTREQNVNIPYSFLPAGTMEYSIGAGIVEDTLMSRFSRATVNYGIARSLTIGAGFEYLSSVKSGPSMPFVKSALRVTNNFIIAGEYTYGVRAKGILIYRLPSNMQLDLNYTWYERGQTAINYNYLEERKATFALPLRIGKLLTYQRFTVNQIILPSSQYTTGEWVFSGSIYGINTNLSTYAMKVQDYNPNLYSNLSLSFRLPARFTLMPQIQYSYTQNGLITSKLRLEKLIGSKAFMNIQYERNFINDLNLAELGFRYDFSFGQAGLSVRQYDRKTSLIQYARGSLISDTKTGYVTADNRPNVGRGGITIIPYIDTNANGGRDPGEPRASGLTIRSSSGRVLMNEKDTTIRILGLEPYTTCLIELDETGFESISWRLPVKTIGVAVDPEILKVVEIPISVMGEASGTISLQDDAGRGPGRILVGFFNQFSEPAGRTFTEADGFYTYLGLASGEYIVRPDSTQLKRLGMISSPAFRKFVVMPGREGDYISDLDFVLARIKTDTVAAEPEKAKPEEPVLKPKLPVAVVVAPAIKKDTTYMIVHEVTQELVTVGEDGFAIQLGAFRKRSNAEALRKKLETSLGRTSEIVVENGLYKVRITGMKERSDVEETIAKLQAGGFNELWIISIKAQKQQWVLIDRQDTIAEIRETIIPVEPGVVTPEMTIQAGAFRRKDLAEAQRKKLSTLISKPVVIIQEGGFHKVRISGFASREEIDAMIPVLGKLGITDIWIPPVKMPDVTVKPEIVRPDTVVKKPVVVPVVPPLPVRIDTARILIDTAEVKVVEIPEVKPIVEEPAEEIAPPVVKPKISLHVGEFRKRSQALNAQKKVESKFGRPVEIFIRWDSYHIVITGFDTREDTFPLYPELAGMGYTNIYVMQEKQ